MAANRRCCLLPFIFFFFFFFFFFLSGCLRAGAGDRGALDPVLLYGVDNAHSMVSSVHSLPAWLACVVLAAGHTPLQDVPPPSPLHADHALLFLPPSNGEKERNKEESKCDGKLDGSDKNGVMGLFRDIR
uniref:Uncharacterized protein n=1 Tax=Oryza sativa subsp. japonica TaxID=39947 RepID=Q33BB4_ORYSJ|nr:hypothetical protein LOC_Os10g03510 [Oryza sativa Japonica Group]